MVRVIFEQARTYKSGEGKFFPLKSAKALGNSIRQKILVLLSKSKDPLSAEDIAEKIKESVFNTYYHLKILEEEGLIAYVVSSQRGFEEKRYYVDYDLAVFPITNKFESVNITLAKKEKCAIVVGSPDPHGGFNLRSRDGYLAGYLGNMLGNKGMHVNVYLDTSLDDVEEKIVVVLGGPLTNTLAYELNKEMKVFFDESKHFRAIKSGLSGLEYGEGNVALIAKLNKHNKTYILLSGTTLYSTEAAITAFSYLFDDIMKKNNDVYVVIEGIDRNSDGKADSFEVLEKEGL